jgi:amino acid adenylation domain-containing protein
MSSSPRTFPLTTVERRFWFLHQLHPQAPVANIGRVVDLYGDVFADDIARAFATVAENPVLRMRVVLQDGEPVGVLGPATRLVKLDVDDADDEMIAAAVDEVVKAPYDLARGPLCRARLLRRSSEHHVLILGAHHLILDGWGLSRSLPRALARAMRGEQMTFGDEDALDDDLWIDTRIACGADDPMAAARDSSRVFWQQRLAGVPSLSLPTVFAPPPQPTGRAFDVEVPIGDELFQAASAFASREGARPVHVFLAAFVAELSRACRTNDLLVGTTRASRPNDDADNHEMGCFVRTKALRVALPEGGSFIDAVTAARSAVRESLHNGAFDAEELPTIEAPLPAALFNYIPFAAFDGVIPGVEVSAGRIIAGGTAFPISLTVDEKGDTPRLVVEVEADRFDEGFAERFAHRVLRVLAAGLSAPTIPLAFLARLGDVDISAMLRNDATAEQRSGVVGGHLGCAVAEDLASGEAPALVLIVDPQDPSRDVVVERSELLQRARAIATSLAVDGVGPGSLVGLCCLEPQRTVEGLCGILFAGAAYVPLDPAAPARRHDAIREQAKFTVLLRDADVAARAVSVVDEPEVLSIPGSDTDPAYAIFTSGSTGTPKGVVISQRAAMAQLQARDALGFPHVDRSLLLAPFFFDGSIETVFWSLTTGGTMHLLGEDHRRDPTAIRQTLARRHITYTSAVPALWGAVLDAAQPSEESLDDLGFVIVGGEKLTPQLVEKHHEHCNAWLVNEYGPTESTVFSTSWSAPRRGQPVPARIPIGRCAPHVRCRVVDEALKPVPVLEAGELLVGGLGLADGYLNAPEQTAAAFVVDASDGSRWYRTGDVVRLWPDGELEWLARRDEQVKVRGVRIEPAEVEAVLLAAGATEAAVVVENDHLLAWVSPATLREAELLAVVQQRLPEAMVPARIVVMASLPKTANDKIDKRALPRASVDDTGTPPRTETERLVARVWSEVLGVEVNNVHRSFASWGGHSLKAAVVVRRLTDAAGVDVSLSMLMVARTVAGLARVLDERGARTASTTTTHAGASPTASPPRVDAHALVVPLGSHTGDVKDARVVFLPGIGGHVFTFAPIAEQMQQPACGLRTFGSEVGEDPLMTVEALAARNLKALDDAGISDDVVFAGYSFGGLVAWEMALQRKSAGRPVRQLVIFDTMAPGYPKKLPAWTRAMLHAESLRMRDWSGRVAYLKERIESVRAKLNLKLQRADAFVDAYAIDDEQLAALPLAQRQQLQRLAGVSTLAHHAYWPRSSTSVPLLLFAAEIGFSWAATQMDDPLLGWRTWVSGRVERVVLKGDHLRLFMAENLAEIARHLDDCARRR